MEVDDSRFKTALTFLREGIHGEQSQGDREETNHYSTTLHHRAEQTARIAKQTHDALWDNLRLWKDNIDEEIAQLEDLEKRLDTREIFLSNNTEAIQALIEGIEGPRTAVLERIEESRREATSSLRSATRKRLSMESSFTSSMDPTRAEATPTEFMQTPEAEVKKQRTISVPIASPLRVPLPAFVEQRLTPVDSSRHQASPSPCSVDSDFFMDSTGASTCPNSTMEHTP